IRENKHLSFYQTDVQVTGTLSFIQEKSANISRLLEAIDNNQPIVQWSKKPFKRNPFCIRLVDDTNAFSPEKVIDGYLRPYGGPHMWSSGQMEEGKEEWIELTWGQTIQPKEVHLVF